MQVVLDVSEFQSVRQLDDLLRKADDEIVGTYIKATQGLSYADSLAAAFAKCCISHNTEFGYYDFLTNDQADEQAEDFKAFIAGIPRASLIPMTDAEGGYAKFAAGDDHWMDTFGGAAITYAQLSNMPQYADLKTPKWVAQYSYAAYYRPQERQISAYKAQGYLLWQWTDNYMGLNQDASVVLGDLSVIRAGSK